MWDGRDDRERLSEQKRGERREVSTKHKLDTIVATAGQGMLQQLEMGEGELKEMAAVVNGK